jgi:nicotinate dehydrogenase subunit B
MTKWVDFSDGSFSDKMLEGAAEQFALRDSCYVNDAVASNNPQTLMLSADDSDWKSTTQDAVFIAARNIAIESGLSSWEVALNLSPVPWTEEAFYHYLRKGHSPQHGMATGPMGQVVRELKEVPDSDLRAMAVYLSSLNPVAQSPQLGTQALELVQHAAALAPLPSAAQRQFEGSCGSCHHDGDGPHLLGLNHPLALSTKLHSARPDNLIRVILEGVQRPASREIGFMPSFAQSLNDGQIADLVAWMRERYAPQAPAWPNLVETVARMRTP